MSLKWRVTWECYYYHFGHNPFHPAEFCLAEPLGRQWLALRSGWDGGGPLLDREVHAGIKGPTMSAQAVGVGAKEL